MQIAGKIRDYLQHQRLGRIFVINLHSKLTYRCLSVPLLNTTRVVLERKNVAVAEVNLRRVNCRLGVLI
ncbi:hypothetical protein [Lyngbya aestuarii]|uniref:hypothetical protein n=1 Tax=Lyngbya aestuarii TaxID=118322 RepID=UPI00403DA825